MTQHIGFRCPDDLIEAIQKEIDATGKDRTTVILEAMRRGFNLPVDSVDERLSRLEALMNERLGEASGITIEELEGARDAIIRDWRLAKQAEKLERVRLALNLLIDTFR